MSKQDRTFPRTASEIERKYKLGLIKNLNNDNQRQEELISMLDQILTQFMADTNAKLEELSEPYPVGAIYVSVDSTAPTFAGTWELLAEGNLIVGLDSEELQELLQTLDKCYLWKRTT